MHQLPLDIVFNILTWLPIKTLLCLRSVSKLWCTVIDSPDFTITHLARSLEEPKALLLSHGSADIKFKQDGNLLRASLNCRVQTLHGSCNGLLCFTRHCNDRVAVIFNPARRELMSLPPAVPGRRRKYGLGFDSPTNTYKVVYVYVSVQDTRNNVMGSGVCTLGVGGASSMSWREIDSKPPCPVLGRAVSAYGAAHWIADHDHDHGSLRGKMVSFDIGKEEFSLTSCPEFGVGHLVDLRGVLGVVDCSSDTHIEIWVLKEYEKRVWVREYKIHMNAPQKAPDNWNIQVIGFWDVTEILLRYLQSYFSYNPQDEIMRYRHIPGLDSDTQVYSHTNSLVSLSMFLPN